MDINIIMNTIIVIDIIIVINTNINVIDIFVVIDIVISILQCMAQVGTSSQYNIIIVYTI